MLTTTRPEGRGVSAGRHASCLTESRHRLKDRMQACLIHDRSEGSLHQQTEPEQHAAHRDRAFVYDIGSDLQTIRSALTLCQRITRTIQG